MRNRQCFWITTVISQLREFEIMNWLLINNKFNNITHIQQVWYILKFIKILKGEVT